MIFRSSIRPVHCLRATRLFRLALLLLAVEVWVIRAGAQLPGGGSAGLNAGLLQLFADIPGFTSQADLQLREKGAKSATTMPLGFALLGGNVRLDIDMGQIKSEQVTADMLSGFKAVGLDKLATIVRKDRKSALLIYPAVRSFVEMPFTPEEARDFERRRTLKKTKLGRETVGGQACDKTRVLVTEEGGATQEMTVWYAAAQGNFPMRVEMNQKDLSVVMTFRDVKLQRPEVRLFDAPSGFQRYASAEQLVQSTMLKALGTKK